MMLSSPWYEGSLRPVFVSPPVLFLYYPVLLLKFQTCRPRQIFLDVAIDGKPVGRIEAVLFMKESPLAAENLRVFCSGKDLTANRHAICLEPCIQMYNGLCFSHLPLL